MIEEHMVIGAQAEYVVRRVGTVVGRPKRADVCGLGIRTGNPL
jgi:hypothetical protein